MSTHDKSSPYMFGDNDLPTIEISSARVRLRQWRATDLPAFAELNRDPEVMAYCPAPLNRRDSDQLAHRLQEEIARRGWGLWAAELKSTAEFIGFIGLNIPDARLPCSPCVEISWRLARPHWRRGYATEAAKAVADFAFNVLHLPEIVAFTSRDNFRSRAVMLRLGMRDTQKNFFHPDLPHDHPLAEHVLFSLPAQSWHSES